jgi:hypothetical protein
MLSGARLFIQWSVLAFDNCLALYTILVGTTGMRATATQNVDSNCLIGLGCLVGNRFVTKFWPNE